MNYGSQPRIIIELDEESVQVKQASERFMVEEMPVFGREPEQLVFFPECENFR